MANMSYCRFVNTSQDVEDCMDSIDEPVSESEHKARIRFVKLCADLVFNFAGAGSVQAAEDWAKSLDVEE